MPIRLLMGEDPQFPELGEIADRLRAIIAAEEELGLSPDSITSQIGSVEEALRKVYEVDQDCAHMGAESVDLQLAEFTGQQTTYRGKLPPPDRLLADFVLEHPEISQMDCGETACHAFRTAGYSFKGLLIAGQVLKKGSTEVDRTKFIQLLCQSGDAEHWARTLPAVPDEANKLALARKLLEFGEATKAANALQSTPPLSVQTVLVKTVQLHGDGVDFVKAIENTTPRFDEQLVDALTTKWREAGDSDPGLYYLGVKLAAAIASRPAQEMLLTEFLEADDPDLAQIALSCLPPDESQTPFCEVLERHSRRNISEARSFVEFALDQDRELHPPVKERLQRLLSI